MTKKHFEALAIALQECKPLGGKQLKAWRISVEAIADVCQSTNKFFKRDRFLAACGFSEKEQEVFMYKIVRHYHRMPKNPADHIETKKRTIKSGLTLEQAQAHCRRSDTSSMSGNAKSINGWNWFDGYEET